MTSDGDRFLLCKERFISETENNIFFVRRLSVDQVNPERFAELLK